MRFCKWFLTPDPFLMGGAAARNNEIVEMRFYQLYPNTLLCWLCNRGDR